MAKAASKVKLPSKAAMTAGDSKTLKAKFSPKGTKSLLKWKSSNKKVATVSSQGKIKALRAGTAVITATMTGKKAKSTCKITVKEKIVLAKSVTLGQAAVGLKRGTDLPDFGNRIASGYHPQGGYLRHFQCRRGNRIRHWTDHSGKER